MLANRRGFLLGLLAAPLVVKSNILMPLRGLVMAPHRVVSQSIQLVDSLEHVAGQEPLPFNSQEIWPQWARDVADTALRREIRRLDGKLVDDQIAGHLRFDLPGCPLQLTRTVTIEAWG